MSKSDRRDLLVLTLRKTAYEKKLEGLLVMYDSVDLSIKRIFDALVTAVKYFTTVLQIEDKDNWMLRRVPVPADYVEFGAILSHAGSTDTRDLDSLNLFVWATVYLEPYAQFTWNQTQRAQVSQVMQAITAMSSHNGNYDELLRETDYVARMRTVESPLPILFMLIDAMSFYAFMVIENYDNAPLEIFRDVLGEDFMDTMDAEKGSAYRKEFFKILESTSSDYQRYRLMAILWMKHLSQEKVDDEEQTTIAQALLETTSQADQSEWINHVLILLNAQGSNAQPS